MFVLYISLIIKHIRTKMALLTSQKRELYIYIYKKTFLDGDGL